MRGGSLPPALLCAALGFALAYAPRRIIPFALMIMALAALAGNMLAVPPVWHDGAFLGLWLSIVATALCVHLSGGVGHRLAIGLSLNGGLWVGVVIAAAGTRLDLLKSLPLAMLCVPGGWLVATRRGIAIKVVTSWLVAISILAAALPLTPTPGYKTDHMD